MIETHTTISSTAVNGGATLTGIETLTNKTLTAPQINDTSSDHQYVVGVNELAADRTVTLPLLTGNDEFVFKDHTQTLTNKTLSTGSKVDTSADSNITSHSMARQAIQNGNFDVWQRGTSVSVTDAAIIRIADRWFDYVNKDGGTLPTLTRSRQILTSGDISNSFYYARLNTNGAGTSLGVNSTGQFAERIEHGTRMLCGNGKKVTISFWARSDIANKRIGLSLYQNYGSGGSPSSGEYIKGEQAWTLTSTWTKYTATITTNTLAGKTFGTANDDYFLVSFVYMWGSTWGDTYVKTGVSAETFVGSGNIDIAQVQLCAGDVALPFQPKSFNDELRACQRYYEKSFPYATAPAQNVGTTSGHHRFVAVTAGATTQKTSEIPYKVNKRTASPTVTTYNTSAANAQVRDATASADCSSTAVVAVNEYQFHVDATGNASTAVGNSLVFHWTAENEI